MSKESLRKKINEHPERWEKLLQALQADAQYDEKLSKLSDREISKLLMKYVWANMELWTYESNLVEQAIERLNKSEL